MMSATDKFTLVLIVVVLLVAFLGFFLVVKGYYVESLLAIPALILVAFLKRRIKRELGKNNN
ncbi:hypothetical protein [Lapidilactobacillus luobeiensis]|uniref:hypothetical protein n=1 Tax=Lapidilactobacillus luobeiensis TaxID=2950371 RepID=UPI0021C46715|nr:hypothetical protein [Lapidilactobacillus luobeiensis]